MTELWHFSPWSVVMFTWDREEVGHEMCLVPCGSFPPAQDMSHLL